MSDLWQKMTANGFNISKKTENNTSQTVIKDYYVDSEVFVTGGTGFLGKALIEKLIRSCEGIKHVYVFMRTKRGRTSEERWDEFKKDKIFNRIRQRNETLLNKLVLVTGELSEPNLGINHYDCVELSSKVNIVFHLAATIKFNEDLQIAGKQNTYGTQKLLDFCTTFANLKSFVHVSTAFSNPTQPKIEEIVYPVEPIDKESFMKCITEWSDESINHIADKLQGSHPNTYTLTKSMAESVVADYAEKFPVCIVRPSIVTSAINDPYPGWVENAGGVTGIMIEVSRGMLYTIITDKSAHMDVVPLDIVVNTLITAARANTITQTNIIRIYNCTSGQINGITWGDFGKLTLKYARKNPTKYVMVYPNFSFRTNYTIHKCYEWFHHFVPAYIFDVVMKIQKKSPIMMKIATKTAAKLKIGEYFALHDFKFGNDNMQALSAAVKHAKDGREFDCDISDLNWDEYLCSYMLGIREYVLMDGMESMTAARRRISTLFWIRTVFRVGLFTLFSYLMRKLIRRKI